MPTIPKRPGDDVLKRRRPGYLYDEALDGGRSDLVEDPDWSAYTPPIATDTPVVEPDPTAVPVAGGLPPGVHSTYVTKPGAPTPEEIKALLTRPAPKEEAPVEQGDLTAPTSLIPRPPAAPAVAPPKDFTADIKAGRDKADLLQMYAAVNGLTGQLNQAFRPPGTKVESPVAGTMLSMAKEAEARPKEDMALDQARYQREKALAKDDPASSENRTIQDAFISKYPGIAKSVGEGTLRQMNAAQLGTLFDQNKAAETIAVAKQKADQEAKHNSNVENETQRQNDIGNNLRLLDILQKPEVAAAQRGGIEERKGVEIVQHQADKVQKLAPAVQTFKQIARLAGPAFVTGVVPEGAEINSAADLMRYAQKLPLAKRFTKEETLALDQAIQSLSHDFMRIAAGANLTENEVKLWQQIWPNISGLHGSPEAEAAAIDYFRQRLAREMGGIQSLAATWKGSKDLFDQWAKSSGLDFRDPLFQAPSGIHSNRPPSPQAAPTSKRPTRTDPETGETREWDGKAWVVP